MRTRFGLVLLLGTMPVSIHTAWSAQKTPDLETLALMERRATEAASDEQCYLYAELVNGTVEYSAHQYASGKVDEAKKSLKRTQLFTQRIRTMLKGNVKRLKRAEILLGRAAFRLTDFLHGSSSEDRQLVSETLTGVERVDEEVIEQLFEK